MKKIIVVLFLVVIVIVGINEKEGILIPNDAIRFRVIANSDSEIDQNTKINVKNDVEKELYKVLKNAKDINEARNIINNNIELVDNIVKKYNLSYDVNYGNNYFPEKEYKGIKYAEGKYESLVITLGTGMGKNWWCVLFPPLCLLDDNMENTEYQFYVEKLINKFK